MSGGPEFETIITDDFKEESTVKPIPSLGNVSFAELIQEYFPYPYGSEKPITLCDAFIRKYMWSKKTQVCMQIRRSKIDAKLILDGSYNTQY